MGSQGMVSDTCLGERDPSKIRGAWGNLRASNAHLPKRPARPATIIHTWSSRRPFQTFKRHRGSGEHLLPRPDVSNDGPPKA